MKHTDDITTQFNLLHPEKYTKDAKKDLDNFSLKSSLKKTIKSIEDVPDMRSNSAKRTMKKGLNYRFRLEDMSKYSKTLKFKDINWKLKLSALGK